MSEVFADTNFWVVLTEPERSVARRGPRRSPLSWPRGRLVTTEDVLTEFLAFLAEQGRSVPRGRYADPPVNSDRRGGGH